MDAQLHAFLAQGAPVLTSSRRLAHWLRAAYGAEARRRGLEVWPTPQVLPWTTWLREICATQRLQNDAPPRFLSEAQILALWEEIVIASSAGQNLLNPASASRTAARSWRRLHQYCIPFAQLAAFPGDEAQQFLAWAQTFLQQTEAKGWLDSARLAAVALKASAPPVAKLGLIGFDHFTPDMEALFARWREAGCDIEVLAAPSIVNEIGPHAIKVTAATDVDAEIDAAARWARAQVESGAQRIAVVIPQLAARRAQVQRKFEDIFAPPARFSGAPSTGQAFTLAASGSLGAYPLVHSALLCLQLAQGEADSVAVGQLLRSPFIAGAEQEAATRALADVGLRIAGRERWDLGDLERWTAGKQCPLLALNARAALTELRTYRDQELPSIWTARFNTLLRLLGWSKGRPLHSAEQQTLVKFHESLTAFGALDELLGKLSLGHALSRLRDALHAERFEPETPDSPVMVIDPDTVSGMQFDAAWVMGLHAGDWPAAPTPDALIPIELQRRHGVPEASAQSCLEMARVKLRRLTQCAPSVVLSWPQRDDDTELRPSPLLSEWPSVAAEELPRSPLHTARAQLFAHRPVLEAVQDGYAPALQGTVKGGARTLELQARCPFRAQAELRLHAEKLRSVGPGVQPDQRGNLVHRMLAGLWSELDGLEALQALTPAQLQERLERLAEFHAAQVMQATTTHSSRLVHLEMRAAVQWVMALLEVERQRPPFRVHRSEQLQHFNVGGLEIRIQPDRVDRLSDDRFLVIDYKTGESHAVNQWLDRSGRGRPARPQLPLYAVAYGDKLAGLSFAVLAPGIAEFRGLASEGGLAPGMPSYAGSSIRKPAGIDTWAALTLYWRELLGVLAQEYKAGKAAVDPLRNECQYCHLSALCRVAERAEGPAADAEEGADE